MPAPRTPLMAGNWKSNLDHQEAVVLVQKLAWGLADRKHDYARCEVVVLPPYTDLRSVSSVVEGDRLELGYGAQDVSTHDGGAYTGEVSATMLARLGCGYVVVGHSERRQYHGEDDAMVNAKVQRVLAAGMRPIVCVGEGLEVREAGDQVAFVRAQLEGSLHGLPAESLVDSVIAYEPVWAIGTGQVASAGDASEVCAAVREHIATGWTAAVAERVRILYGGSVKPANVARLMAQADIDGALVGGASLQADEFGAICRFYDMPVL